MSRRPWIVLSLAVAAALALAGCDRGGEDRPNASARLALDGPPGAVDAGIYLALARDFDDAEGVTLGVRAAKTRGTALQDLLAGRAQFAVLDIHDLARARQRGRDVVGVMAIVQRPLAAVLAGPSVRRPRALEGRRVGVSASKADDAVLSTVVRHDGGDPARVDRVRIAGGDMVAAVRSGRVAAAVGRWDTDGLKLVTARPGAQAFRADDYGAPAYPELVLCVTGDTLLERRPVVRATVAALRRGYDEALVDPESAVGALVDGVPGLDRAAEQASFDAVQPAFLEGVTRFGDLVPAQLRAWARWEAAEGITRRPPDVGRAFALGF
jgi:ABC-type nitrate/sulfonate/bicarbonate transport system substrate-binding protein